MEAGLPRRPQAPIACGDRVALLATGRDEAAIKLARKYGHDRGIARQDLGVQPVGLSQQAQGFSEVTALARIDYHHWQARSMEGVN